FNEIVSTLRLDTTGQTNTGSGAGALFSNSVGSDNTATGANALANNTSGSSNIELTDESSRELRALTKESGRNTRDIDAQPVIQNLTAALHSPTKKEAPL